MSPGQCVLRSHGVGVPALPTGRAGELGLALTRVRVHHPAGGACLTGVRGIHCSDSYAHASADIADGHFEGVPTLFKNLLVEPSFLGNVRPWFLGCASGRGCHAGDGQIFQHHEGITWHDACGCLSLEVRPPITLSVTQSADLPVDDLATSGPLLASVALSLKAEEPLTLARCEKFPVKESPVASRDGLDNASVHSDTSSVEAYGFLWCTRLHQDREIPTVTVTPECGRPRRAAERT